MERVDYQKTICIIGAGASGICAARRCWEAGFPNITVFEQSNHVGGLWNYTDEVDVHSSMYKGLRTNSIKECVSFKDFPIPDYIHTGRSFLTSDEYLRYLNEFAEPIKFCINFGYQVVKITRNDSKWVVAVKKTSGSGFLLMLKFDVLFVCIGSYTVQWYPPFASIYKKPSIHSHNYRKAEDFTGKTVAVVGAGLSGTDIAEQVLPYAQKVYICYKPTDIPKSFPETIVQLPEPIDADETSLRLADGSTLENIDVVIYCTGYRYNFPFMDKEILQVKYDGKVVSPTFMHCAHRDYSDSFFIIGLTYNVFAIFETEAQVQFAIASMKGEVSGFSQEDVDTWEERRMKELLDAGHTPKHFHFFEYPSTLHQWEYFDTLAKYSNQPNWIPKIYEKMGTQMFIGWMKEPFEYRKFVYRILNDEEFEVIRVQEKDF